MKYKLKKQGMLCKELLRTLKIYFKRQEPERKKSFLTQLKERVNKINTIICKLISPIGGIENSIKYIKVKIKKLKN